MNDLEIGCGLGIERHNATHAAGAYTHGNNKPAYPKPYKCRVNSFSKNRTGCPNNKSVPDQIRHGQWGVGKIIFTFFAGDSNMVSTDLAFIVDMI
ncbi:hypothetical protein [Dyadobacter diqingensis]|uniref:hypothetical protein n=1 Tax=Dyadobacter diqingensis TaxID=2938121 RepID=UPI0020C5416F|nr:hypothetical protein [Dyadobacter diqingensis]